jgi:NADPH:quinone reductase-like Zn-dependent oxidoreductase
VSKLPDGIADETAAAMMLKGMTVRYLLRETYKVKSGETILLHAAAGGVGLIACQWAKALGATVIGTAGSEEKAELARAHGCDHVILYKSEDVPARVRELTGGKGVPVVYDGVGKDTLMMSLDSLSPAGCWSASAMRPARSTRSMSACWRPRARSTSPARRSRPTRPGTRICRPMPATCSTW